MGGLTGRVCGLAELWKLEAFGDGAGRGEQTDKKDATEGPFVVDGDFDFCEVEDWPKGVEEIGRDVAAWGSWLAYGFEPCRARLGLPVWTYELATLTRRSIQE